MKIMQIIIRVLSDAQFKCSEGNQPFHHPWSQCGLMDKASASGAGDSGFESRAAHAKNRWGKPAWKTMSGKSSNKNLNGIKFIKKIFSLNKKEKNSI